MDGPLMVADVFDNCGIPAQQAVHTVRIAQQNDSAIEISDNFQYNCFDILQLLCKLPKEEPGEFGWKIATICAMVSG